MKVRVALAAAASTLAFAISPFAQAQVLSEDIIARYTELCAWLTDVSYSPGQKQALRAQIEQYWRTGDREAIQAVIRSLDMHAQLLRATPEVRETTLAKVRPGVLVSLQRDAANGGADSAWLYQQFVAANPPLAQGHHDSVPLTRDTVDASLDYAHFLEAIVLNRTASAPTPAVRQAAYAKAARDYPRLSAEQQLEIAAQRGRLVEERNLWRAAGPQGQAMLRAQLGGNLTAQDQALLAQAQQARSHAGWAGLQSQMEAINRDSQTIMGGGTTWNQTLGRWEQRGGIVTEFDSGVVRVP
jgi:hypothetical protein